MDLKFKWNMFASSFTPLWFSIIILDGWDIGSFIMNEWNNDISIWQNLLQILYQKWLNLICIIGLIILSLIAIIWLFNFMRSKHKSKNEAVSCKIITAQKERTMSSEFLLAYILPLIAFDFTNLRDIIIFLLLFFVLSFLCIRNNNIYTNIFLEFMGYKLYTCDIEYVITLECEKLTSVLFISKNDMSQKIDSNVPVYDFSKNIFINLEEKIK